MNYNGVVLPEAKPGEIVVGAIVLAKVMTPEGDITYREHTAESLHAIEMLGMVETFRDTLKYTIMQGTRVRREGEEDHPL